MVTLLTAAGMKVFDGWRILIIRHLHHVVHGRGHGVSFSGLCAPLVETLQRGLKALGVAARERDLARQKKMQRLDSDRI